MGLLFDSKTDWSYNTPSSFRTMVESFEHGERPELNDALTPHMREFFVALRFFLENPGVDPEHFEWENRKLLPHFKRLQRTAVVSGEEPVNVFKLLRDGLVPKALKYKLYDGQIRTLMDWISSQDRPPLQLTSEDELTLLPPQQEDSMLDPSMESPGEPSEEAVKEAYALIIPVHQDFYRRKIFDLYDERNVIWEASPHQLKKAPKRRLRPETIRRYYSTLTLNKHQVIQEPGAGSWFLDSETFYTDRSIPDLKITVFENQFGVPYLLAESAMAEGLVSFSVVIGQPDDPGVIAPPRQVSLKSALLPEELVKELQRTRDMQGSDEDKVDSVSNLVQMNLDYSNDPSYNEIYKKDKSRYYLEVWQHRQVDCDVAANFGAELLRQLGFSAYILDGNQSQIDPDRSGSVLMESNNHARLMVYLRDVKRWKEVDMTPPSSDQERKKMEEDHKKKMTPRFSKGDKPVSSTDPVDSFAKIAGCSPGEAAEIIHLIERLRNTPDSHGNLVYEESKRIWQVLAKNSVVPRVVERGPVSLSLGNNLRYPEQFPLATLFSILNPRVATRRVSKFHEQPVFHGLTIWVILDLSGSMAAQDDYTHQLRYQLQRDSAFLLTDSMMSGSYIMRTQRNLSESVQPLQVSVLGVLNNQIMIFLPLTGAWTPLEQVQLYHAANQSPNGDNPDHLAFQLVRRQIEQLNKTQDPAALQDRLVLWYTDGVPDSVESCIQELTLLRKLGAMPFGFGISESADQSALAHMFGEFHEVIKDLTTLASRPLTVATDLLSKKYLTLTEYDS